MKIHNSLLKIFQLIENEYPKISKSINKKNEKILIYMASAWSNNLIDCILALALKLRGYEVEVVIPDIIPITEDYDKNIVYDHNKVIEKILQFVISFKLDWIKISDFISAEEIEKINLSTAKLNYQELEKFEFEDIPVGKYSIGSSNYIQGIPADPGSLKEMVNLELSSKYLQTALILARSFSKIFDETKYKSFIHVGGKSAMWAPPHEIALKKGISCVNWENWNTKEQNNIVLSREQPAIRRFYDLIWENLKNVELTIEEREDVSEFFKLWKESKNSPFDYQGGKSEELRDLNINTTKFDEVITILPNTVREDNSNQFNKKAVFPNQIDFVKFLIIQAKKTPKKLFILRAHPVEAIADRSYIIYTLLDLLNIKNESLPSNFIILKPESKINSYSLAEISDKVIVWVSTLGLELSLKGRNIITCGRAGYSGKGFTTDIESKEDLVKLINSKQEKYITKEQVELAIKYAHLAFFKCKTTFPFINFSNPFKNIFHSLSELEEGNNDLLDQICDNILYNGYFIKGLFNENIVAKNKVIEKKKLIKKFADKIYIEKANPDQNQVLGDVLNSYDITTWFSKSESMYLFDLVSRFEKKEIVITELGSYLGGSANIFAKAMDYFDKDGTIYCIDAWEDAIESHSKSMIENYEKLKKEGLSLKDKFLLNMNNSGSDHRIKAVQGFTNIVDKNWNLGIDILFIDADHSYESTKEDFQNWVKFLNPGGIVVFHDVELPSSESKCYEGPGKVIEEFILESNEFIEKEHFGYIYSCRKKNKINQVDNPTTRSLDKVSVICCTLNRPEYLKKALESIRKQTETDFEIIVVNDGGIDVGEIVSEKLKNIEYHYYSLEKNIGLAAAIDFAIEKSTGRYLMFIDDDNEYLPNHIELLKKNIINSGVALAYSDSYWCYYENFKLVKKGKWQWDYSPNLLMFMNYIDPVQVILDKSKLEEYGDFDRSLRVSDWDLWMRFAAEGDILHIPEITSLYGLYDTTARISEAFDFKDDAEKMITKYSVSKSEYLRNFSMTLEYIYNKKIPVFSESIEFHYIKSIETLKVGEVQQAINSLLPLYDRLVIEDPVFAIYVVIRFVKHLPKIFQYHLLQYYSENKVNANLLKANLYEIILNEDAEILNIVNTNYDFFKSNFNGFYNILDDIKNTINEKPVK